MLLPDSLYRRTPKLWMLVGIFFLLIAFGVGSSFHLFPVYLGVGIFSVARSIWVYMARWKHHKRNELRMTKTIHVSQYKPRK